MSDGRLRALAATDRRLLSGASLTFASRAFAKSAQIVFLVAAAHLLSVEQFAAYSYVLVLAAAFTILSDTGAPLVAGRDIAASRHAARERFWDAVPVVLASAGLAIIALFGFGAVDAGPGSTPAAMGVLALFVLANRVLDLQTSVLRALGAVRFEALLQAAGAALFIVVALVAAAGGAGVTAIVALLALREAGSAVVAHVALRRDIGPVRWRGADWRSLLRAGIALALAGIALAITMRLPLTVLGNVGSVTDTAVFSAAQRFADGAMLLAMTAGLALLPGLAHLAAADPPRVRRLLVRVAGGAAVLAAAGAAVAWPLGDELMGLVFGDPYRPGADALRILLLALPAYAVLGVCWYALIALDGEALVLRLGLAGAATSVAAAAVLVPGGGTTGAAWAYVAPLALMAVGAVAGVARRLGSPVLVEPA